MTKLDDLQRRWRKYADYKGAYDALDGEFDVARSRGETKAAGVSRRGAALAPRGEVSTRP